MNASFFLIRTKMNRILGPVVKEDLASRILNGELDNLDEICPASGYWVFLHEREEIKNLVGVEAPLRKRSKESDDTDETETETATVTATGPVVQVAQAPAPKDESPGFGVERPNFVKILLYLLTGILIFLLLRIYQLTQS